MTEENAQTAIEEEQEQEQDNLTTEPEDTTEYTLNKQELDQERANARRAREERAEAQELYESANERAESLQRELEELKKANKAESARLEARQQVEQDKLDEMDPDLVDTQVIKNIQTIERRLKAQREEFQKKEESLLGRIDDLSAKTVRYEKERAESQRKAEIKEKIDSVLNRVEASLKLHGVDTPGQHRTEAMKIADELVDKGDRKKPVNVLQGVELMEECYLKVIAQHNKKKKGVSVDGGKAGVTTGVKTKGQRKTGSLDEVAADMLKDKSWKED